MTDRELLEAAARAAEMWPQDFELGDDDLPIWDEVRGFRMAFGVGWWHPGNDDGDALRLMVKLAFAELYVSEIGATVSWPRDENGNRWKCDEYASEHDNDLNTATRRAIVRAAAAIGAQR